MTLAKLDRLENCEFAVRTMMGELGDRAIDQALFDPQSSGFEKVMPTTWDSLKRESLIEQLRYREEYRLTGKGWLWGLDLTGKLPETQKRAGQLFAAMKRLVKGRKKDCPVPFSELVRQSELDEGPAFNIIEANLLQEQTARRGASWIDKGRVVLIPRDFNIESIDIERLFSRQAFDKIAALEERLAATEDELRQYRCPYCGAALNSSGSVPLSEHYDGYYETFECGYTRTDGHEDRLCPSDPKFPTLDEFELKTMREGEDWICYAFPKTVNARKVGLSGYPAKTEEEAKQSLVHRYKYMKGELEWNQVSPVDRINPF